MHWKPLTRPWPHQQLLMGSGRGFKSEPAADASAGSQPPEPKPTAVEPAPGLPKGTAVRPAGIAPPAAARPTPSASPRQGPLSLRDVPTASVPAIVSEDAQPEPRIWRRGMRQITIALILASAAGLGIGWLVISVWLG